VARSRKAIQSLRLRLHSGLRQRGRLLRSGLFLARLKPCPSSLKWAFEMGWSGRALRDCPLMTKRCHEWSTRLRDVL